MNRDEVVRALREIASLLRIRGESEFRVRAYETAASRLGQVQGDLGKMVRDQTLTDIPGIGAGLAAHISQLVETGHSKALDELRTDFPPGIVDLVKVPSLGPKRAVLLWKELGVGDLDALARACREGRLKEVRGFGPKTEAKLLAELDKLQSAAAAPERRLLGHALPAAERFIDELGDRATILRTAISGDARRFREEVDVLAVVVSSARPKAVLTAAASLPSVARELHKEDARTCALRLFDHDLRLELHVVDDSLFAPKLMRTTGSDAHWQRLVALAEKRGLSLTEDGLFRGNAPISAPDEESLYAALDMDFVPPELREDQGEIEAALKGKLPSLVRTEDIRGIVHSHSRWSDGSNSLEEMAIAAKERGYRYLTVTEHSPTASYAGGVKLDDLRRLWDEIDEANEIFDGSFRLLKGVESDILPDGSLDYPDALLERMDVVVGSIHARHSMDEEAMTRRILGAMDNPHLNILGHLTGRLIQRRDPYAIRVREIFERAAARGVAVEVNGNPHRLDLHGDHVRLALSLGVKLVCSTDSHSIRELDHVRYSVGTARRGGARKQDVLNTLDADGFVRALRQLKKGTRRKLSERASHGSL